ncbi:MAG: hypothetical protein EP332_12175 [Bacteroidetes bacterium]|nr:MAG: hypothetical protein EP332_12175 [Bacteroidota bacterium]
MIQAERLKICATCTNRSFHRDLGTVCNLTSQVPSFLHTCPDYTRDHYLIQSKQVKEHEMLERKQGLWKDLGNASLGLVLLILGSLTLRGSLIKKGGDLISKTMK